MTIPSTNPIIPVDIIDNPENKAAMDKLELESKKIEIEEKQRALEYDSNFKRQDECDKLDIEKFMSLTFALSMTTIDADRTILGSEPFQRPLFNSEEEQIVKRKLMEIVGRL